MRKPKGILSFLLRPLLCILVPTLALLAYWTFIYDRVYEAEVVLLPRTSESSASGAASALLGAAASSTDLDSRMLAHYIASPDMLTLLDADLGLRAAFTSTEIHRLQRLRTDATADEFLAYYRARVRVIVDSSAIMRVQAKAFSGDAALAMANRIIHHAEAKLNAVSVQMAAKQVEFIQGEVSKAEALFKDRSARLTRQQNTSGLLDPSKYSEELMKIIARLESELAQQRATLAGKESFISPQSPQLSLTRAHIEALVAGIASQRERLSGTGSGSDARFSEAIMQFNEVALEAEFAAKTYAASLLALQAAHAEAALGVRTLVVISRPDRLEVPAYPRLGYWTLTALALFSILLVLGHLLHATVMSHVDR